MLDTSQKQRKSKNQLIQSQKVILDATEILHDYSVAVQSREASLVGRREVLSGKAKFGIFGDGKELAQIALAKAMRKGDWRAGYYRDQTLMFALGISNIQQFFAQLYAHASLAADPHNAGRQMNAHYATRSINAGGSWNDLTARINTSSDMAPTASQMPRLVGLGHASCLYRDSEVLQQMTQFSKNGDEVVFGTIGNASCAEGLFWEAINAIGVLKAPVVMSIWDDEYGISVHNKDQITKENLSELLGGFQREPGSDAGFDIYTVRGWDYLDLVETYAKAGEIARRDHIPAIVHVIEMTQPQGHSTSGSHERYKSAERLAWEAEHDCIRQFRQWIIEQRIAPPGELDQFERNAKKLVENFRVKAWKAFSLPIFHARQEAADIMQKMAVHSTSQVNIMAIQRELMKPTKPYRHNIMSAVQKALIAVKDEPSPARDELVAWRKQQLALARKVYGSHLYSESNRSALHVEEIKPVYSPNSPMKSGFQLLNHAFDAILARDKRVVAFGEDVGKLGGVNQTYAGLQEKYGSLRVFDTGIREATILGQAIGLALRGLRPIAEIQYLDYLLYALQTMSDDLATLHWRTHGGQNAPVIVSTRGHRLEGVWHSGSPMAGIINLVRGIHVCVPRDMVRAAGFYNTLLKGDEPGLVVEVLNGYRLKERLPDNLSEMTVPLGVPEMLREGTDVTIVTYGPSCYLALEASDLLQAVGIDVEVIDVQTLLPFDRDFRILESLQKTSRILFLDEDVPGGATAYMLQQVIEVQGGYHWLDSEPRTLAAQPHRPAYGSDGGYFSKPNVEDIFDAVYDLMNEVDPVAYPMFYK